MVCVVLMPLHPVPNRITAGTIASQRSFRLNLTLGSIMSANALATFKSAGAKTFFSMAAAFCLHLPAILEAAAVSGEPAARDHAAHVQQQFIDAREALDKEVSTQNLRRFSKAAFDWAEFAANDRQREELAEQGVAAARQLIERDPEHPAGHYYLGMNLGQLARTKRLAALRFVGELEEAFHVALRLDPEFDFGGPDRNLGLLYLEAPGWPISVGNRRKAREHLQQAAQRSPEFLEDHFNLIDAHLKWGERTAARKQFHELLEVWPEAKEQFSGDKWLWTKWEARRKEIEQKLQ
jgi:tetratricopeptide (TPR) repeat protein